MSQPSNARPPAGAVTVAVSWDADQQAWDFFTDPQTIEFRGADHKLHVTRQLADMWSLVYELAGTIQEQIEELVKRDRT